MSVQDDVTGWQAGEANEPSLEDYYQAVTPDDIPFIGAEPRSFVGQQDSPPSIDDAIPVDDETKSRIKTGWKPPEGKVADLPARGGGIPTIDEWLDFFSRVVIRVAMDFAIEMSFRGIDESLLTDREVDSIKMSDEERKRIARPFAEFAYKNKFMRKNGREIIAAAGSIDAVLQLGLWYTRMTRIAIKYRRMTGVQPQPMWQYTRNRRPRPSQQTRRAAQTVITVPVIDEQEVIHDERFGQGSPSPTANGHEREWRPNVTGPVVNPGG